MVEGSYTICDTAPLSFSLVGRSTQSRLTAELTVGGKKPTSPSFRQCVHSKRCATTRLHKYREFADISFVGNLTPFGHCAANKASLLNDSRSSTTTSSLMPKSSRTHFATATFASAIAMEASKLVAIVYITFWPPLSYPNYNVALTINGDYNNPKFVAFANNLLWPSQPSLATNDDYNDPKIVVLPTCFGPPDLLWPSRLYQLSTESLITPLGKNSVYRTRSKILRLDPKFDNSLPNQTLPTCSCKWRASQFLQILPNFWSPVINFELLDYSLKIALLPNFCQL